ncbi:MAG: SDR family NAD(P)-dependent oxidoreductase [Calditrichaceae bacterium]
MKKVIIIGATSGIGKELARQMINKGYKAGGCGRTQDTLTELEKELAPNFTGLTIDIRETDKLGDRLDQLVTKLTGMDICIISSGISRRNTDLDWSTENDVLMTNVNGFTAAADYAVKYFLKQQSGHLVGITSLTKFFPNKSSPAYNASKAFESNYLDSMRLRLSGNNLFVTEICPGFIDTPIVKKRKGLMMIVSVDKAVRQIIKAIELKKKNAIITRRWQLIRWLIPFVPDWIFRKLT